MKKIITIAVLAVSALSLSACDYEAGYRKKCNDTWRDSGYKSRLLISEIEGSTFYTCMVRINGRWIPEENVRLGDDS